MRTTTAYRLRYTALAAYAALAYHNSWPLGPTVGGFVLAVAIYATVVFREDTIQLDH